MHGLGEVAVVTEATSLREVVMSMTRQPLGAACVVESDGQLTGLVTDGDIRRALQKHDDIRPLKAGDVMTPHPVRVDPEMTLGEAVQLMEKRNSQISVLPVVDGAGRCVGLLRLHDVYQH
jgi:arabinose-5-phosphate isomerase